MASSAITDMQNWTTLDQAATQQIKGPNNELNQDMFLKLMLEQLKYQDPLNPMSNQEFLAQQAQFTQLNELQKMNTQMVSNNTVQQCVSLIGKEVTMIDPDDPEKTIKGIVTEAVFDANGSSIKVDGKNYPLGLVTGIRTPGTGETPGVDVKTEIADLKKQVEDLKIPEYKETKDAEGKITGNNQKEIDDAKAKKASLEKQIATKQAQADKADEEAAFSLNISKIAALADYFIGKYIK